MSQPPPATAAAARQSIVFFHPDLGIGGAERLVLDAALGLQSRGHRVTIFTSHRDPAHCFDEARDGRLDVRVRGATAVLPAAVFGRLRILLAVLRHVHLVLRIGATGELAALRPTAFFVDQLSAGVPLLRWLFPDVRILFYCHFPDLLLAGGRGAAAVRAWRWGFDRLEGWGMRGADRVVVNSAFTAGVVRRVWPGLPDVGVVYPCVGTEGSGAEGGGEGGGRLWEGEGKKVVLSINRFERKKDVGLALRAFARLPGGTRRAAKLVVAGGYDGRVRENVAYHEELTALAGELGLSCATAKDMVTALSIPADTEVLFLLSVPAQLKAMLLRAARLLVYTPTDEHFGIVPLEAMLAGVPVLAASSGGPLETVRDGGTGWLRDAARVDDWTEVMEDVLRNMSEEELAAMGRAGRERVRAEFSPTQMARRLEEEIGNMIAAPRARTAELQDVLLALGVGGAVLMAVFAWLLRT